MDEDGSADASDDADATIVGVVCGGCLAETVADRLPTFCGACRARYDRGAPVATVHYGLVVADIELGFATSAQLHGDGWTDEAVEHVRAMVEG